MLNKARPWAPTGHRFTPTSYQRLRPEEVPQLGVLSEGALLRTPDTYPIVDFALVERVVGQPEPEGRGSASSGAVGPRQRRGGPRPLGGKMLHLFQLSKSLPHTHSLADKAYVVDAPPPFTHTQSILEFWYHAAFGHSLPQPYLDLQGALRRFAHTQDRQQRGRATKSLTRCVDDAGLEEAVLGVGDNLLPDGVQYWFLCSVRGEVYHPRYLPRSLNLSPSVHFVPADAIEVDSEVQAGATVTE